MLALMPCERSVVLPEGVASGVLNGGDVGGVLDRGGVGGGIMSLTRSWETDRDLIGGGGRIRVVWRREVIRPTRGQFGDVVLKKIFAARGVEPGFDAVEIFYGQIWGGS